MNKFSSLGLLMLLLFACGAALAQNAPSEVQDEHDKRVKADADRATTYHNNADDYPNNKSSAPNVPTPPARIPVTPKAENAVSPITAANDARVAAAQPGMLRDFNEDLALANRGDTDAILRTASHYRNGYGTKFNYPEAYRLYMSIATRNDEAAYQAADMIFEGNSQFGGGISSDERFAYGLMELAAKSGHKKALEYLQYHPQHLRNVSVYPTMEQHADEMMAADGVGTKPTTVAETDRLIAEYSKRKKDGSLDRGKLTKHAEELLAAGKANLYGVGVPVDLDKALKLLSLADNGGERHADEYEGWTFWAVTSTHPRDPSGMCDLLYKGGLQYSNRVMLEYERALCSSMLGAKKEQRTRLEYAAKGGMGYSNPLAALPQAATDLGIMRLEGEGGPVDEAAGIYSLQFAAGKGERNAEYLLGLIYEQGLNGVAKDPEMATKMFQQAAAAGSAEALAHLNVVAAK